MLEIGTGTGWSASLLSHRLGDDQVVSIEIDPSVAHVARRNLAGAGWAPWLVTGDGADGFAPAAPYDRVIATCSVRTVPYAWVAQTRPGGIILTPWGTTLENSALLRLAVDDNSDQAVGRIIDWATFMLLRTQRPVIPDEPDDFDFIAEYCRTDVDLADFLGADARFGIGLHVPDCRLTWELGEDGYLETLWLLAHPGGGVRHLDKSFVAKYSLLESSEGGDQPAGLRRRSRGATGPRVRAATNPGRRRRS